MEPKGFFKFIRSFYAVPLEWLMNILRWRILEFFSVFIIMPLDIPIYVLGFRPIMFIKSICKFFISGVTWPYFVPYYIVLDIMSPQKKGQHTYFYPFAKDDKEDDDLEPLLLYDKTSRYIGKINGELQCFTATSQYDGKFKVENGEFKRYDKTGQYIGVLRKDGWFISNTSAPLGQVKDTNELRKYFNRYLGKQKKEKEPKPLPHDAENVEPLEISPKARKTAQVAGIIGLVAAIGFSQYANWQTSIKKEQKKISSTEEKKERKEVKILKFYTDIKVLDSKPTDLQKKEYWNQFHKKYHLETVSFVTKAVQVKKGRYDRYHITFHTLFLINKVLIVKKTLSGEIVTQDKELALQINPGEYLSVTGTIILSEKLKKNFFDNKLYPRTIIIVEDKVTKGIKQKFVGAYKKEVKNEDLKHLAEDVKFWVPYMEKYMFGRKYIKFLDKNFEQRISIHSPSQKIRRSWSEYYYSIDKGIKILFSCTRESLKIKESCNVVKLTGRIQEIIQDLNKGNFTSPKKSNFSIQLKNTKIERIQEESSKTTSKKTEALLAKAATLTEKKKYNEAKQLLTKLLTQFPDSPIAVKAQKQMDILLAKQKEAMKLKRMEEEKRLRAERKKDKQTQVKKKRREEHEAMKIYKEATFLARKKKYIEAKQHCKKLLSMYPNSRVAKKLKRIAMKIYKRAKFLARKKRYTDAKQCLGRLKLYPDSRVARRAKRLMKKIDILMAKAKSKTEKNVYLGEWYPRTIKLIDKVTPLCKKASVSMALISIKYDLTSIKKKCKEIIPLASKLVRLKKTKDVQRWIDEKAKIAITAPQRRKVQVLKDFIRHKLVINIKKEIHRLESAIEKLEKEVTKNEVRELSIRNLRKCVRAINRKYSANCADLNEAVINFEYWNLKK